MTLKRTGLILLLLQAFLSISAQQYILRGTVTDSQSKETLVGVPLGIKELPRVGFSTDDEGVFNVKLAQGRYTLVINYVGYENYQITVLLDGDKNVNVALMPSSIGLGEVVISADRVDKNISSPQTGVEKLTTELTNKLPVLLGERDIIKAMQLLPGFNTAGEGSSGFFVRGGTTDQNLISLDDVPLYNASHLMGFFSTFNSDVVRDVTMYKGSMPAQYGGRLSSVMDVQMKSGDKSTYKGSGSIGLISSKLSIEGPIQQNKSSFIIGARRTYADAIGRAMGIEEVKNSSLYFYDLNMKMNFTLSDKDYLTVSAFNGKDKMAIKKVVATDWSNLFGAVKWTRIMNDKWMSNTSFQYNKYNTNTKISMDVDATITSKINDYTFKQEFRFAPTENQEWKVGVNSTYHNIMPGKYRYAEGKGQGRKLKNRYSWENGLYIMNTFKPAEPLEIVAGVRLSTFSALGKGEFYTLDDNKNVVDSTWYGSGKFVKTYFNVEPRLSMAYKLDDVSSIKAAYGRNVQNIHMLTNSAYNTPYDRWTSSSNNIKPQIADQVTLGYFRNFSNNMFEFSVEGYYKNMKNQIDFKDNAELDWNDDVETELLFGKGRAYGVEFLLRKQTGRLTGWIGYTLSKSEKKINGINNDKWYNARQDRTHDISIVLMYELNKKWSLSTAWVYYTGDAVTYPSGKYHIDDKNVLYFTERNGYRAPAYHRLDLGATCILVNEKNFFSELSFSLYNAYGRENPYMIDFRTNDDDSSKMSVYQYTLFRFIPSISWNFRF
ncbi:TonB-dependent receptor [Dysgonomonas sp. 25]|uniref:TonB-dependent receptor n=1 Tax=Dysgonomonas sp. 25 TaxID=2302933 RepID=UPI0013D1B664|nr:TonB-dependent receptor [Dysgonomonas sp. 25]NDV69324.1 TonB-dependent receptor [Dysgonomonas sp. 25]